MTTKHFIYKTVHSNGKYYVGRHSTDNLDDGYIGSGIWPLSIKDRSSVSREILEFADTTEQLIELERQYLREHYGRPNCMNMTDSPTGWDSERNPMKDPEVAEKISGDNHWTKKEENKFSLEMLREKQNILVERGKHFFQQENHPNKDGSCVRKAIENKTHINLTEDNPAKQWSRNGTHPWFKDENGESVGGRTNRKRIEQGTHNWLGPDANNARIEAGTHNFLGSSLNERMLVEGRHPSQQKVTCSCCGWTVSVGMFKRWHDNGMCHMNLSSPRYNPKLKQR